MSHPSSPQTDASTDRPLILIGGGEHCHVLIDTLQLLGRGVIGITDNNHALHGQSILGVPILGHDEVIHQHDTHSIALVNAVGSIAVPACRRKVFRNLKDKGYTFETIIHPSAVISPHATLGEGAQIMAGAVIQPGANIGANSLINTNTTVDHHCVVGDHCHLAPGVTLSGDVRIGDTSHLGTGATVIQGIVIGHQCVAGAGAVVVRDVSDQTTVVGVPARPMKPREKTTCQ